MTTEFVDFVSTAAAIHALLYLGVFLLKRRPLVWFGIRRAPTDR